MNAKELIETISFIESIRILATFVQIIEHQTDWKPNKYI